MGQVMSGEVPATAYAALDAGLCPIPPMEDGSKRPIGAWKQYQSRRPTDDEMFEMFDRRRAKGVGTVTGAVAGNLEMLEFEGRAVETGVFDAFLERCEQAGLGPVLTRVVDGYRDRSPSGRIHLLYRCDEIAGNTKLARLPVEADPETGEKVVPVLIETRGEGGFTVLAPSNGGVHPTGGAWRLERGGFDTIAMISPEERRLLWDVARSFDQHEANQAQHPPKPSGQSRLSTEADGPGVADDYARRVSWEDVLDGWTYLFTASDGNPVLAPARQDNPRLVGHHRRRGRWAAVCLLDLDPLRRRAGLLEVPGLRRPPSRRRSVGRSQGALSSGLRRAQGQGRG
jgi:putative DNA primase/helicase